MNEPVALEFSAELCLMFDDGREDDSTVVLSEIVCRCDPEDCPCGDGTSPCMWGSCGPCVERNCGCEGCYSNREILQEAFNHNDMPLTASSVCVGFRGETVFSAITGPFEHPQEEGKVLYGVLMRAESPYSDEMNARHFWAYSSSPSVATDAYKTVVRNPGMNKFRGWDATDVAGAPLSPAGQLMLPDALAGR
ncbi:hypothetical protein ACH4TP_32935 [Streptomyces sp. NPDC021012]|uniref:hypothetical protein n=1 Tax=Streptomyces sp. NPDC021012 TaxID=3365107 RepID=UPI0037A2FFA2